MAAPYPPIEPYDHGMLDTGDGRLDLGSPLDTAWELARAWPGAQLVVIGDSGHKGSASMHSEVYAALDRFARQ
ncbi:MAG TPA: hypothetical protein VK162_25200 [Streptosporangiaceae bacterium]|nr:hypothetical protein [Streptosporangiaceae bacterium]